MDGKQSKCDWQELPYDTTLLCGCGCKGYARYKCTENSYATIEGAPLIKLGARTVTRYYCEKASTESKEPAVGE